MSSGRGCGSGGARRPSGLVATTAQPRGDILAKAAGEMTARAAELGELLSREEGKWIASEAFPRDR